MRLIVVPQDSVWEIKKTGIAITPDKQNRRDDLNLSFICISEMWAGVSFEFAESGGFRDGGSEEHKAQQDAEGVVDPGVNFPASG